MNSATNYNFTPDTTTEEYAKRQSTDNIDKTITFLEPILDKLDAKTVLDVGCGIGTMTTTLSKMGYEAYGVDLDSLEKYWKQYKVELKRFSTIKPFPLELPFSDNSVDCIFSFGAMEHVGTSNGHTDRLPNYREIRKQWIGELFRACRPNGSILLCGPNRMFPVDLSHNIDTQSSFAERTLSKLLHGSIHFPWRDNFLWSYGDIIEYLDGHCFQLKALSVREYLYLSRVPRILKPITYLYINHLPNFLLKSGFNPWVMALITKLPAGTSNGSG